MKISFRGWLMIAIAAISQTCAIGLPIAVYSTISIALQRELGTTRTLISTALGLETFILALLAPLVGILLVRHSLKRIMLVGAALNLAGYTALAFVHSIWPLLAIYALVIGPGMSFMGMVPANTLITRWFVKDRGKALGIVHMPFIGFLGPPVAAYLALHYGTPAVFLALAATFALVAPLLLLITDWPVRLGQKAWGEADGISSPQPVPEGDRGRTDTSIGLFFGSMQFWLISFSIALLSGGADIFYSHIAGLALERGLSMTATSILVPVAGAGGFVGSIAFGWLGDRVGPVRALILVALIQALNWSALFLSAGLLSMCAIAFVIGSGIGAIIPLHGMVLAEIFPISHFSRAMGFSYWVKMPFIFGAGPLAGYIFDVTGSYHIAISLQVAAYVVTAALGFLLLLSRRRVTEIGAPAEATQVT